MSAGSVERWRSLVPSGRGPEDQAAALRTVPPGQVRHEFQVWQLAHDKGIALNSLRINPLVYHFATALLDASHLRDNYQYAAHGVWNDGDMGLHPLEERYGTAQTLATVSVMLLEEGFLDYYGHTSYLTNYEFSGKIRRALEKYGYTLRANGDHPRSSSGFESQAVESVWNGGAESDESIVAPNIGQTPRWWRYRPDPDDLFDPPMFPDSQLQPEEKIAWLGRCREEAERLLIPEDSLTHPAAIHYLAQLSSTKQLLTLLETGSELSDVVGGISPTVQERMKSASHLMKAVILAFEDGLAGTTLDPSAFAEEVSLAVSPYGFQVIPNDAPRSR